MTWHLEPVRNVTTAMVFNLARANNLVMDNLELAMAGFNAVAETCNVMFEIRDEDGQLVATTVIWAVVEGEDGIVDFVPVPKFFAPSEQFHSEVKRIMTPAFRRIIDVNKLRRISARVPKSRSRTKHALMACGFEKEGVAKRAIRLSGRDPESVVMLAMLAKKE